MSYTRHGKCLRCGRCCYCGANGPPCPKRIVIEKGMKFGCALHGTPTKPRFCVEYPRWPGELLHDCGYYFTDEDGIILRFGDVMPTPAEERMPDWMVEYLESLT